MHHPSPHSQSSGPSPPNPNQHSRPGGRKPKWKRRRRGRRSYRRPSRSFSARRSTRTLLVGIAIVLIVVVLFIIAYREGDVLDRVGDWSPLEISAGEPPPIEEVQRRAEALTSRGTIVALGSMLCPKAPGLVADAEAKLRRRFPDVEVDELLRLDSGASEYLAGLPDTRTAMNLMDEVEGLYDDLERDCM